MKNNKKGLLLFPSWNDAAHFIVVKKIKISSVYVKQWEICKEEPTGTLNFRADFD